MWDFSPIVILEILINQSHKLQIIKGNLQEKTKLIIKNRNKFHVIIIFVIKLELDNCSLSMILWQYPGILYAFLLNT